MRWVDEPCIAMCLNFLPYASRTHAPPFPPRTSLLRYFTATSWALRAISAAWASLSLAHCTASSTSSGT